MDWSQIGSVQIFSLNQRMEIRKANCKRQSCFMITMAPPPPHSSPRGSRLGEWRRVCTVLECLAHKSAIFLVPFVSSCNACSSHCRGGLCNLLTRPPFFSPLSGKKRHGMQRDSGRSRCLSNLCAGSEAAAAAAAGGGDWLLRNTKVSLHATQQ